MKAIIFFISLLQLPLLTVGNRFLPPFAFTATATTTTTIRISNSSTYTRRRKSNSCSLHSPYPFISSLLPPCSCLCRPHGKNHQMRWGRGGGRYSLLLMDSSFNKNDNKKSCGNCDQNRNNYGDSDADGGDNIQKAFTNLLSDLSSMRKSRISKLKATSSTSSDVKTWRKRSNHDDGSKLPKKHKKRHKQEKNQNIYNVLSRNRELCRLYSQNDHYYITNITSVVGPMHYRKVEAMICRHPKLMTDIFLHQSNSAAGTNNNNCNNNSNLRSVFDQLLMDLNLSPTFISSASTSYSCKKIEQLEQKLIPQSSSSSSKTAILPRMNRNNIRIIVKKLFTNELQMSSEDLFKVIMKAPQLLSYSSYNIEQSISYLQNELQLTNDDIRRMILIRPMVLAHNFHSIGGGGEEIDEDNCKEMETKVHENMDGVEVRHTRRGNKSDQIIHFLKSDLNIDHKRVIVRYPQIFELKPKGLMKKVRAYYDVLHYLLCLHCLHVILLIHTYVLLVLFFSHTKRHISCWK